MRQIHLFDNTPNMIFPDNTIKTTKYNFITFLPLCLLFQFTTYSNVYFLLVAIILAIKEISPQEPTVAIIPFIFVIIVGIVVEAFEEFKKWRNDTNFNNSPSIILDNETGAESEIRWANLKVGNIIRIGKNEIIPADVLIIKTSAANNFCYMQTTNLDGESALKPREIMPIFQGIFPSIPLNLSPLKGCVIEVESPSCNIYQCNGSLVLKTVGDNNNDKEALMKNKAFIQIENTLLRGTTLKNVDYVYGIIIYTGRDSKIMMNIQPSSVKSSSIEDIINIIVIGVIIFVFVLCIICSGIGMAILNHNIPDVKKQKINAEYLYYSRDNNFPKTLEFFKHFGAYFIMFNNIIPISLAITFTLAKVVQILLIEIDPKLQMHASDQLKVLSSRLQEDLGKVKYIFTDKTGTLTRNEMVFKGCSVYGQLYFDDHKGYSNENVPQLQDQPHNNDKTKDRFLSLDNNNNYLRIEERISNALSHGFHIEVNSYESNRSKNYQHFTTSKESLTEFYLNIALNHNVLTEYDEGTHLSSYQGPNPDEVALVSVAKEIGLEFIERIGNDISIKIDGEIKQYEILQVFPYSSERKRSGIIVKDNSINDIHLYVKGADDKIFAMACDFSKKHLLLKTKEHLDLFGKSGLRTLCYASKSIKYEDYNNWAVEYVTIKTEALLDKSKLPLLEKKISEIEANALLIGVSGLEDRLQDDIKSDIGKFIEAGIQVWMITGDQLNTAESIGYSSNFFQDDTEVFKIRSNANKEDIHTHMKFILEEMRKMEKELSDYKLVSKSSKKPTVKQGCKTLQENQGRTEVNDELMKNHERNISNIDGNGSLSNPKDIIPKIPIGNNGISKHNTIIENQSIDIDDVSVLRYMYQQNVFDNTIEIKQEAETFVKCMSDNESIKAGKVDDNQQEQQQNIQRSLSPDQLYQKYEKELEKLKEQKEYMGKITMITNLDFTGKCKKNNSKDKDASLLNFGLVIEGNALIYCISDEIKEIFWELIKKSKAIICCRCTPIQKSNIVEFVKEKSNEICLAIGDGGNDVNMIKKANVGVGIFGKEGHQAAYNSDYAIGQFKYLKQLIYYHGRYILLRNSYFIYFFFYKGILFCFPNFLFGFYSGFSGTNFYDFVWFTFYTGLVSTVPPVVYMVFEEDIDVAFPAEPEMRLLLPDIYREYRDSIPFNVVKYFVIFALGMIHSAIIFFWNIYAFEFVIINSDGRAFSFWSMNTVVMLTVFNVQFIMIFIDTSKWSLWVFLLHFLQMITNILFGLLYGLGGSDELGTYTYDTLGNFHFWLILFCATLIGLLPIYISRFFWFLFSETIVNNLRNKKSSKEFLRKSYTKKLEHIKKYTRNLCKFKKIYSLLDNYQADNCADRKMKEVVLKYTNRKKIMEYDENQDQELFNNQSEIKGINNRENIQNKHIELHTKKPLEKNNPKVNFMISPNQIDDNSHGTTNENHNKKDNREHNNSNSNRNGQYDKEEILFLS